MEVVRTKSATLCNLEVFALLKDLEEKAAVKKTYQQHKLKNLATVCFETKKYLTEKTPCVRQTPEGIAAFLKVVEPYQLTKAETLQVVNLCPTTAVEISLIVEESEERLTEEQVESLIELVAEHLSTAEQPSGGGKEEADDEAPANA